jgi:hypothetical protein
MRERLRTRCKAAASWTVRLPSARAPPTRPVQSEPAREPGWGLRQITKDRRVVGLNAAVTRRSEHHLALVLEAENSAYCACVHDKPAGRAT